MTRTNIGLFKKNEMTVSRRFSDFLGLHDKLAEKYLHKGRLVPAPPEKNVVGTFPSWVKIFYFGLDRIYWINSDPKFLI